MQIDYRDCGKLRGIIIGVCLFVLFAGHLNAAEPLHIKIDRLIGQHAKGKPFAKQTDDAAFMRRVYLDFSGRIPSSTEAQSFLANKSAHKRTELIDQLLASQEYAFRMQDLFHVWLMERRGDNKDWEQYLHHSFTVNKPWNRMVQEILYPDVSNKQRRGAIFFYKKRLIKSGQNPVDYPGLTRDVARLFLGQDLQCAQCHDHLFIKDYKQVDFQGLYSVFKNTSVKKNAKFKYAAITEKPMKKKLEFVSVFESEQQSTGPRLPTGKEFEIVVPKKKEPAFSPLKLFAQEIPNANNNLFSRNIANRLWFMMMGRGIVHPLDLHHSENPPSHPEVLQLLSKEFVAHQFDIKWMFKELALTKTYQRSTQLQTDNKPPPVENYQVALERRLTAEQLLRSTLVATGEWKRVQKIGLDKKTDSSGPTYLELKIIFQKAFANSAKVPEDSFSASVKGALFLLNDDTFLKLLTTRPGNLQARLSKISDNNKLANELYISLYSRQPNKEEVESVKMFLKSQSNRTKAIEQLTWAMLSSMEFYVNH